MRRERICSGEGLHLSASPELDIYWSDCLLHPRRMFSLSSLHICEAFTFSRGSGDVSVCLFHPMFANKVMMRKKRILVSLSSEELKGSTNNKS